MGPPTAVMGATAHGMDITAAAMGTSASPTNMPPHMMAMGSTADATDMGVTVSGAGVDLAPGTPLRIPSAPTRHYGLVTPFDEAGNPMTPVIPTAPPANQPQTPWEDAPVEEVLAGILGTATSSTSTTSTSTMSRLGKRSDSEQGRLDLRSSGSRSSGKRAKGHAVLAYLQRLAKQNAELLARMEALEGRQADQKEALERRRPGEELSPTPLPREESQSPQKELWSTSKKEFCFEASPVHRGGSKDSRDSKDSLHSPACSAETATPKTGNSPSLEQRRELLKKARDDNARVRAELRQQDDRGHYSDCPLSGPVLASAVLQQGRRLGALQRCA
eukprot:s2540_g7.t1